MMAVYRTLSKNIKLLLRSRSSAAIVLVAPLILLLVFWVVVADDSQYTLQIATSSTEQTEDALQFYNDLSLVVDVSSVDDLQACLQLVKTAQVDACAHIPPDFSYDANASIVFFIDESQVQIKDFIEAQINSILREKNKQLSEERALNTIERLSGVSNIVISDLRPSIAELESNLTTVQSRLLQISEDLGQIDAAGQQSNTTSLATSVQGLRNDYVGVLASYQDSLDEFSFIFESLDDLSSSGPDVMSLTERGYEKIDDFSAELNSLSGTDLNEIDVQINSVINTNTGISNKLSLAADTSSKNAQNIVTLSDQLNDTFAQIQNQQVYLNNIEQVLTGSNLNAQQLSEPIPYSISYLSEGNSNLLLFLPVLIVVITMITSLTLSAVFVTEEKQGAALFRVYLSPLGDIGQILGVVLTSLFVVVAQFILFLAASIIIYPQVISVSPLLLLIVLLNSMVFSLIGIFIGYLFSTYYNAMLGSVVSLVTFMLLSDVFVPISWIPDQWHALVAYSPFSLTVDLIRRMIILNSTDLAIGVAIMVCYIFALFIIVLSASKSHRIVSILHQHRLGNTYK